MATDRPEILLPEMLVHRVGGGSVVNLRLTPLDQGLVPPGISVLLGGTPREAVDQMRRAFPRSKKWQATASTVGTTPIAAIRQAGFDVMLDPTDRFSNHGRLIHPAGESGFTDENLVILAQTFQDTRGC